MEMGLLEKMAAEYEERNRAHVIGSIGGAAAGGLVGAIVGDNLAIHDRMNRDKVNQTFHPLFESLEERKKGFEQYRNEADEQYKAELQRIEEVYQKAKNTVGFEEAYDEFERKLDELEVARKAEREHREGMLSGLSEDSDRIHADHSRDIIEASKRGRVKDIASGGLKGAAGGALFGYGLGKGVQAWGERNRQEGL